MMIVIANRSTPSPISPARNTPEASPNWLEMIRGAVWPHSSGGIVGAVLLGLGRAMGETIAAALVIGSSAQITAHMFAPGDSMPAVIANQFGEATGVFRAGLMGLGVLLFGITIIINVLARGIVQRSARRKGGA